MRGFIAIIKAVSQTQTALREYPHRSASFEECTFHLQVKETIKLQKTTSIYESESFDRELQASLQVRSSIQDCSF